MRIPLPVRLIAGVGCAVAYIWAVVLAIQGRTVIALVIGALGTASGSVAFSRMRESPY
jgi:hypothetical protein